MKTYKVKNYKGNLVESLKKFADSHKGLKIVEAKEINEGLLKMLKIKTSRSPKDDETLKTLVAKHFQMIVAVLSDKECEEYCKDVLKKLDVSNPSIKKILDTAKSDNVKIDKTNEKDFLDFVRKYAEMAIEDPRKFLANDLGLREESKEPDWKIEESEAGVVFSISTISGAKPKRTEAKLKTIDDLKKIWEENGEEELIIDFDEDDGPTIEVYDEALRQL